MEWRIWRGLIWAMLKGIWIAVTIFLVLVYRMVITGGRLRPFALAALLILATLLPAPADAARRCRALDGDTVRCGRERIRLRDVYAAERGEPGAETQRRALQRQLDSGEVRIRRHGKDEYGRTLGDVYVNGRKVRQSDIGPRGGHGA